MDRVKDKVAIVTGAGRGIGRAIALTLAKEGADVAIWEIATEEAERTAEQVEALGRRAKVTRVDVSSSSQVTEAAEGILGEFGKIDILVNNAAIHSAQATILELSDERWDSEMAVDLTGVFYCTRAVLKGMIEQRGGKIVNIGSICAETGRPFSSASYAAAKAGIVGFSMSVALSVAKYGVNVNVVNPGPTKTELWKSFTADQIAVITGDTPLRRGGIEGLSYTLPEDIANAVLFFASSESDWITGACLNVMGGRVMG